jgi:8-oxo-dGTP diphosphatase
MMEIHVTAAIFYENGKYLICQRAKDDELALLWEFPGGKAEDGETLEECIVRECREELDVDVAVAGTFGRTSYSHANRVLVFTFFHVNRLSGELTAKVHEQIKWVSAAELEMYRFCPADVEIVEKLARGQASGGKG